MNAKIQITLPKEDLEALQREATERGISPTIFTRMLLHERYNKNDAESKTYFFRAKNWREIEAYVDVKCLGNVEAFTTRALEDVMSKNRLTAAQKAKFERILKN